MKKTLVVVALAFTVGADSAEAKRIKCRKDTTLMETANGNFCARQAEHDLQACLMSKGLTKAASGFASRVAAVASIGGGVPTARVELGGQFSKDISKSFLAEFQPNTKDDRLLMCTCLDAYRHAHGLPVASCDLSDLEVPQEGEEQDQDKNEETATSDDCYEQDGCGPNESGKPWKDLEIYSVNIIKSSGAGASLMLKSGDWKGVWHRAGKFNIPPGPCDDIEPRWPRPDHGAMDLYVPEGWRVRVFREPQPHLSPAESRCPGDWAQAGVQLHTVKSGSKTKIQFSCGTETHRKGSKWTVWCENETRRCDIDPGGCWSGRSSACNFDLKTHCSSRNTAPANGWK